MTAHMLHLTIHGETRTLSITGDTDPDLAAAVHRHARGQLGGSRVDIVLDSHGGTVISHGAEVGSFTLTATPHTGQIDNTREADGIRWGYTLHDLDRIARTAVHRRSAYTACDVDERYAVAWHAAVEHLYTADTAPTAVELIRTAWEAADTDTRRTGEYRGHGRSRGDGSRSDGATVKFWAYWETVSRHTASPEEPIVERLALAQVWPRLAPDHQQALQALAAHGNYQAAADSLGLRYNTFFARVRHARAKVLQLWWEGETPRRGWRDKRRTTPETQLHSISAHIRKRRRAGVAA